LPVLIFVVALLVRLINVYQLKPTPFFDVLLGDAHGYDLWAQRLAGGDWIGSDVFYQAPLYPYFLGGVYAIFGRDLLIVRIIQAVIGSASCVLLGLAAARMFSKRAGLFAGLALALWAPAIFFDGLLQKSVLDMFFMCLALWIVAGIRPQASGISRFAGLGAALAALSLSRENGLLLIVVVGAWIVLRGFYDGSTAVLRRFYVRRIPS
jgi:4-amino-4-deoxy-L-arabinose transferase-like glycosyltransferase